MNDAVIIEHRFRGPPESANGGYACGVLAAFVGNPAEVTLRQPPPLDRRLAVERAGGGVRLLDGDDLVAEARSVDAVDVDVPEPVSFADAQAAAADSWITTTPETHPFPTCFVCGPGRPPGDGLRVFVGPVEGRPGVYASPWVPDASLGRGDGTVRDEFVWAALDCAGGIGALYDVDSAHARPSAPSVLGRLTVGVHDRIEVGEPGVAAGWEIRTDGRKRLAGSALWRGDGTLVGSGLATWIRLQ